MSVAGGGGARAARAVFALVAAALLAGMAAKAALDVSWPWDVWYYHLPFAGRIWGILPASAYVLTPLDEARYQGYPLLAEALQGLLWRLTGRPEAANFVAFSALLALVAYARVRLSVPWWLATLALLAIPLVQIHATACYIDLPANAALAVVVLEAMRATVTPPSKRALGVIVVAAVLAGNMRLQLEPLLLVALVVIGAGLRRSRAQLLALVLVAPLAFASPLKNLVVHHNPAYPVALHVGGRELPFAEEPYDSSPPYLEFTPRPVRWLVSLAEVGIQPLAESRRWTIDQYMPPESRGNRMGGFFGAYVALNLVAFTALAGRRWRQQRPGARRRIRAAAGGLLLLSVACSLMPQSHELRYYLVWMLVLVLTNASLLVDEGAPRLELGAAFLVSACLAVVLASTRGWHVVPQRYPFEALLRDHVDPAVLAGVVGGAPDGGSICVARPPWTALYAAPFHPPARYVVREAESDAECAPAREAAR